VFIDQGHCFNAGEWNFSNAPLRGIFALNSVYEDVTGWEFFEPVLSRVERIELADLWSIAREIPRNGIDMTSPDWQGFCKRCTTGASWSVNSYPAFARPVGTRSQTGRTAKGQLPNFKKWKPGRDTHLNEREECCQMAYIGPIAVRDGLLEEIRITVRRINALPENHMIRQRLTRSSRSFVTTNSFAAYALDWLLETIANQEPLLRRPKEAPHVDT
jgi:hypothetical protein